MSLVLVDDAAAAGFQPFALTRPGGELRAGALLVRERWETATGVNAVGFVGAPHLDDFDEPGAPRALSGRIPAGTIVANTRFAVALRSLPDEASSWTGDGRLAAVRLASDIDAADLRRDSGRLESFAPPGESAAIDGMWLDHVWDLVRILPDLLNDDIHQLAMTLECEPDPGASTVGTHPLFVEYGATVEPFVLVDASNGPVLVRRDAVVRGFTTLVGPCYIGQSSIVNGGRVATSAIGEHCRVHGEVSTSIFTGYANKGHDGFLGHSVLGRWVNLGAGTVNSNLKNNYSPVAMWTDHGVERTGMQFLGAFLGDHVKTAIGTRLTTGAVIGAAANVVSAGITPRYVPPFAWGVDGSEVWELDAFLETAARAMQRRHVELSDAGRRQLSAAWRLARETA